MGYKKTGKGAGRRGVPITEQEFKQVRVLADAGLTTSKISGVVDRSPQAIDQMKRHQTFEAYVKARTEYNNMVKARMQSNKAATKAATSFEPITFKAGSVSTTPSQVELPVAVKTDGDQLERIAKALERLADAWERSPKAVEADKPRRSLW